MTLQDIKEKWSHLEVCETRTCSEEYIELVFLSKHTSEWEGLFSEVLGTVVKPAGVPPQEEHNRLTERYGGIYDDQVLFRKDMDTGILLAMLWPWQDNIHTTLKLALVKRCS